MFCAPATVTPEERALPEGAAPAPPARPQTVLKNVVRADDLWGRLARSSFRSRFHLGAVEEQYLRDKGWETIRAHALDFVASRLAPAEPARDGRQTPWRGHPVFIAQHATATCCRKCLSKWHGIITGHPLTEEEQLYIVDVLMQWLERQTQPPVRQV